MLPVESLARPQVPAFKRTTAACQHCQAKKRRCDRRMLGSPCTNCRLDHVNCFPGTSKLQSASTKFEKHGRSGLRPSTSRKTSSTASEALSHTKSLARLPPFIKALPDHLDVGDVEYLRRKGVFEVPEAKGCREMLRSYFQFAHPLLPLLDIESFLGPMAQSNSPKSISLVLFYAVMCSGAAHVELEILQTLGYKSRKAARRAFFNRARVSIDCFEGLT